MKKDLTEIIFIIDRSGSMAGLEDDTIGGFNSFVERQKQEEGEAYITTILFDDKIEVLHNRENIHLIDKLSRKEYYVRGCTALLDAVGFSLNKTVETVNKLPEQYKPEKVMFVITTDGYENASKEFDYHKIKNMITYHKEHNWEFLFLGANIDVELEAGKLGINPSRAVKYYNDESGIEASYKSISAFASKLRKSKWMFLEDDSWKEDVINNNKEER